MARKGDTALLLGCHRRMVRPNAPWCVNAAEVSSLHFRAAGSFMVDDSEPASAFHAEVTQPKSVDCVGLLTDAASGFKFLS